MTMLERRRVIINNPRLPYVVIAEDIPKKDDFFCIVRLTGGFYRLLHINSGLTATDVKTLSVARTFIKRTRSHSRAGGLFKETMMNVSWSDYCSGKPIKKIFDDCLRSLTSEIGHVSKNETKNELYYYPPEYLI